MAGGEKKSRRGRDEGDGCGLKGKKEPPVEREGGGLQKRLKGREREEC